MDTKLKSQMIMGWLLVLVMVSSAYGQRIREAKLVNQEQAYSVVAFHVALPEHIGAATFGLVLNKKTIKTFGVVQSTPVLTNDLIEKQNWYVLDKHSKGYCLLRIGEEAIRDGVEGFVYLKEVYDKEGRSYRKTKSGLPAAVQDPEALWYSQAAFIHFEQPGLYYGGHLTLRKVARPDKNGWVTIKIQNNEQAFQQLMVAEDLEGVDFVNVTSHWKKHRGSDFVTILGPALNP